MRCSAAWMRARPGSAIESSRSRCHSGWSISAATWSASPVRTGLPVSAASWRWKRRSPSFQPARSPPASAPSMASSSASASGSRRPRRAASAATPGSSRSRASSRSNGPASCALSSPPGARRSSASSATNEPAPGRVASTPRRASAASASRTDARPTSRRLASSRSPGSRSPGASRPARMSAAIRSAIRSYRCGTISGPICSRTGSITRPGTVHAMPATFNSVDPRTGEPVAGYDEATPADVAAAVAAAEHAFHEPALRDRDARAALLRGAAARLRAAGDDIVDFAGRESGLPEGRLRGELERTAGQLEAFAGVLDAGDYVEAIIDTADPAATPIPRPDVRRMLVAIGPVAVFGASNFPLAFSTAGGDTASALAAGCPVVVKGHPSHPGTGELVARELQAAAADAGLPDGTFAHLLAAGIEVGEALVDAPGIAAVGFTGSTAGGRAIADRAAARPVPIPVYAEMGSINPIVVTEAALAARAEAIADGLVASVSNFGGQLCTKPGVVFVPDGAAGDEFARTVAARLDGVEPTVLLNERLRDALAGAVERLARRPEVRPLGGAPAFAGEGYRHQPAAYEAPAAAVADGSE